MMIYLPAQAEGSLISKLNYPHVGMLLLSWFIGLLIYPWIIRLSHRIDAVDRPREYKSHGKATPFLGGVGIYIAFTVTIFSTLRLPEYSRNLTFFEYLFSESFRQMVGLVLGGFFVLSLGIIDDFRPINAVYKLVTLFVATLILYYFDIKLSLFPVEDAFGNAGNVILTLLWITGVTSALNSLDNMDGASGGSAAIATVFVFIVAWGETAQTAQQWLSYAAVALLGGTLAFMRYNWNPARIFLGDNGSFLLGFLLASILVLGKWTTSPVKSIIIPCMILTVPLYDITLSTLLRLRHRVVKGKNIFDTVKKCILFCGRDHTTHRLVALGYTKKQAVMFLYFLGIMGGTLGLVVRELSHPLHITLVMLIYFMALFVIGVRLNKADVYKDETAVCLNPSTGRQPGEAE